MEFGGQARPRQPRHRATARPPPVVGTAALPRLIAGRPATFAADVLASSDAPPALASALSTASLLVAIEVLIAAGVAFVSLSESIDTTSPLAG